MVRRLARAFAAVAVTVSLPTAARAAPPAPRVDVAVVHVDPCLPRAAHDTLVAALRVELRELAAAVTVGPAPLLPGHARIGLVAGRGCDATRPVVRVWVGPGAIVPNGERQLDLGPTPDPQRDRVVAITAAELLAVALDDPRRDARPADGAPLPPPRVDVPAAAPAGPAAPALRHRIFAGASVRAGFAPAAIHGGPRLDARFAVTRWLDATGTAIAWLTSDATPLGDVATATIVGRGGVALARRRGNHQLDVGVYGEVGRTSIDPDAASDGIVAREASGVVVGVGLAAGAELLVAGPLRLRLEVDVAHALASVEGEAAGRAVPGYGGAFAAAALSAGVGF